jgi:putative ABC transport system permease protein
MPSWGSAFPGVKPDTTGRRRGMQSILQDLRYSIRMFAKSPGFTLVALLALALGIGANTAIFSVVNDVLLRNLPYREPDRLVMVWENNRPRSREMNVISPANYLNWQDQNTVFEQMAAFNDRRFNLTDVGDPEEIPGQAVTVSLFPMLGVGPALGRAFSDEDAKPGAPPVVILGHGLWQRRFGGETRIVGDQITLNGNKFTVVGVMPAGFRFYIKEASFGRRVPEMWIPVGFEASDRVHKGRYMAAIARLKPGVSLRQAQAEMSAIGSRLEAQYPEFDTGWGINLVPLPSQMTREIRLALIVLFAAVAFVLLIACANVANLILARASIRAREMSIRAALGANRSRLVRQLLTESLLLAVFGGLIGLLIASWGVDLLVSLAPADLIEMKSVSIDYRMLTFTLLTTVITGLAFGVIPALASSRLDLQDALKEGSRSASGGAGGRRTRKALVVAEIAMTLLLLVGAGLLIRSLARLHSVDPGFDPRNLLTVRLILPGSKYREPQQVTGFYRDLIHRVETLPGVKSVGANAFPPFAGPGSATSFLIEGRPMPAAGESPVADVRIVDANYFETMKIPFHDGRNFTDAETTESRHVVVVNQTLVRQYFPDENPLGKQLTINMKSENVPSEIIGVVGDVKHVGLDSEVRPMTYWPHPELPIGSMTLMVRTSGDPMSLVSALRNEVKAIDKDLPLSDVRTMEQLLAASTARSRFLAVLLAIFAALALTLACVGIYGVMSTTVSQRVREIGIRMALGARQADVVRMVVGQGMVLVGIGIAIGLTGALALTRLMSTLLFGVTATDPMTFASLAALLGVVALVACLVPALRATKVDPLLALRCE